MKIHAVNFLVALGISALVAYGLWAMDGDLKNYIAVGSFAFLAGTLVPAIGIDYEYKRRAVNVRVVCGSFAAVGFFLNLILSYVGSAPIPYIIVSAVSFLLYMFIANAIYSVNQ